MDRVSFFNGPEGVLRGIARWEIRHRARSVRQSIISAAHAYMAASAPLADALEVEPASMEALVVELQWLVGEYASILGALGHDAQGAVELTMDVLLDAYAGAQPDATLSAAVRRRCSNALVTPRVE